MLDPAIIDALEVPLPPEPSRVVEERVWLSEAGQRARRSADRIVAQYEADTARWLAALDDTVAAYARVPLAERADSALLTALDEHVAETEALAERRAAWRARFAKRVQRDVKHWFTVDASVAAVARATAGRLLAADDRVIAGLLDYALFLRSVRAERDAGRESSPAFDDPQEMLRSLRAAVAA